MTVDQRTPQLAKHFPPRLLAELTVPWRAPDQVRADARAKAKLDERTERATAARIKACRERSPSEQIDWLDGFIAGRDRRQLTREEFVLAHPVALRVAPLVKRAPSKPDERLLWELCRRGLAPWWIPPATTLVRGLKELELLPAAEGIMRDHSHEHAYDLLRRFDDLVYNQLHGIDKLADILRLLGDRTAVLRNYRRGPDGIHGTRLALLPLVENRSPSDLRLYHRGPWGGLTEVRWADVRRRGLSRAEARDAYLAKIYG